MMLLNHETREYSGLVLERIKHLQPGGKMGDLPTRLQHNSFIRKGAKNTGGPNMRLLRLKMDEPSLTVTAYIFNKFIHPTEDRYITPREAACLQDFPIDYEFKGTLGQVQKQIGNAVPVKLGKAIANEVARYLKIQKLSGDINIYSYFTGAGGLDLGFEQANVPGINFKTVFSTDIEECVENTINHNRPNWNFHRTDIQTLSPEEVRRLAKATPHVIIGGPPCQPFSVAGKQKATQDPLGTLYRDYLNHVKELKPNIVIMENVYGLAQIKSENMLDAIYKAFQAIGYSVTYKELMSADYGTPQKRRRLFFVAALNLQDFQFPEPLYSKAENLFGLPLYNGAGNSFKKLTSPIRRDL